MSDALLNNSKLPDLSKKKIVIAIDGLSSCGKSTLARDLAKTLEYRYIDSGAMYRAVSLLFLRKEIYIDQVVDYSDLLIDHVEIHFQLVKGKNTTFLNNQNVENEIRKPEISEIVSDVASNSSIRKFLVRHQRKLGEEKAIVMDGRDIGTVVFPDAEFKLFITADLAERARRRHKELLEKGLHTTFDEVKENLAKRDRIDSTRQDSPLSKAADAIELDTTDHSRESQLEYALKLLLSRVMP